jgi:hypothetical protein
MPSWFAKSTTLEPGDPATQLGAYKEGRRDERLQAEAGAPDRRLAKKELADAHDHGRREERLRRRASPLGIVLRLLLLILAAMAVVAIVLAARYGSFAAAGQAVDTVLSSIVQSSTASVH